MKKFILYILIVFYPLVSPANTSTWSKGTESSARIISSGNYIGIEIELNSGWKIETSMHQLNKHIDFSFTKKNNLKEHNLFVPKDFHYEGQHYYYKNRVLFPIEITPDDPNRDVEFEVKITYPICKKTCFIEHHTINYQLNLNEIDKASKEIINYSLQQKDTPADSSLIIYLFAILGGLILNLMPCVLPVLGIKLSFLSNHHQYSKQKLVMNLLATAFGIIVTYEILALLVIFFKYIGQDFGYSFYFQNPNFIVLLTIILMIAASSILDQIEIKVPSKFADSFSKFESKFKSGLILSFLTGCFTAIMATPCSAPFVTTAVGFALAGSYFDIIVIFFLMGVGLSTPYLLFAIIPGFIKLIPKTGKWMLVMKKIFAALVYLSVFWFVYILANQLSYIAALVFFLILILIKFFLELKSNLYLKVLMLIILLSSAFVLTGIANKEHQQKQVRINEIWHKFDMKEIQKQVSLGKVVIVDVTAAWCATCQFNKIAVLDSDYMTQKLSTKDIYAMRGDVTNKFPEDLKMLMKDSGHFAVPFNIVYGPQAPLGIVLSSILSIAEINEAIENSK